jgi:hypothetical protein
MLGLGIGLHRRKSSGGISWTSLIYILKSGATWYKREINNTEGYFKLWYSSDSGANYEMLFNIDLTEQSVLIDLDHEYVHSIVGTAYKVTTTGGQLLYST